MTDYTEITRYPARTSDAFLPDQLVAGIAPRITDTVTLTGAADLLRGSLLGKITLGAASSAAKSGGNTGNGTFVLDSTTPILAGAVPGIYSLRCIEAVTNGGKFQLISPEIESVGIYIIVAGASGTITIANQIKGVLTDGSTDFVVGDGFDITIAAGSGKYKLSTQAAVDGSQTPCAILAGDAAVSGGDVLAGIYKSGEFNANAVTYGASWTAALARPYLEPLGIYLKDAQAAAAFS